MDLFPTKWSIFLPWEKGDFDSNVHYPVVATDNLTMSLLSRLVK